MTILALSDLRCPHCGLYGTLNFNMAVGTSALYKCANDGLYTMESKVLSYNNTSGTIAAVTTTATAGDSSVALSWELRNMSQSSAEIYRAAYTETNIDNATLLGTIDDDTASYTDSTPTNDTSYHYWVKVISDDVTCYSAYVKATPTES